MELHTTFGAFADEHGQKTWEEFSRAFQAPFLEIHLQDRIANYEDSLSATHNGGDEQTSVMESGGKHWRQAFIAEIAKPSDLPDSTMVTLGRAGGNDLIVPHMGVSKLHAVFRTVPAAGRVVLHDAGSRFGTRVNGFPVGADGVELKSADTIVLAGAVTLIFFYPKDFYSYLRLKLRTGKTKKLTREERPLST